MCSEGGGHGEEASLDGISHSIYVARSSSASPIHFGVCMPEEEKKTSRRS